MSFLSAIFGGTKADNGKTGEQLDAELRALQVRREAARPDLFATPEYREVFNEHLSTQEADTADAEESISREFDAGLDDGAKNVSGFIGGIFKVAGKALSSVALGIPVWVWVGALVFLFFYFGGGVLLRRKILKQ